MSEAKPQDGTSVKGYRSLSDTDISRMNSFKAASRQFCDLLATELEALRSKRNGPEALSEEETKRIDAALRCASISRTKMQEACMWAVRGVALPDDDC